MSQRFKFECVISFDDDDCEVDESFLDCVALCYGDEHQDFTLHVVPGTVKEIKK